MSCEGQKKRLVIRYPKRFCSESDKAGTLYWSSREYRWEAAPKRVGELEHLVRGRRPLDPRIHPILSDCPMIRRWSALPPETMGCSFRTECQSSAPTKT